MGTNMISGVVQKKVTLFLETNSVPNYLPPLITWWQRVWAASTQWENCYSNCNSVTMNQLCLNHAQNHASAHIIDTYSSHNFKPLRAKFFSFGTDQNREGDLFRRKCVIFGFHELTAFDTSCFLRRLLGSITFHQPDDTCQ